MDTGTQQPISDDQELAKVLAGVTDQADDQSDDTGAAEPIVTTPPVDPVPAVDQPEPLTEPEIVAPAPEVTETPAPELVPPAPSTGDGELDSIKLEALQELRPLVDKLNVSPEEKFDTYLLLLRSTDDKALIEPAHEAAKGITDEARRAQALLDIIKEIDFLSQNK